MYFADNYSCKASCSDLLPLHCMLKWYYELYPELTLVSLKWMVAFNIHISWITRVQESRAPWGASTSQDDLLLLRISVFQGTWCSVPYFKHVPAVMTGVLESRIRFILQFRYFLLAQVTEVRKYLLVRVLLSIFPVLMLFFRLLSCGC